MGRPSFVTGSLCVKFPYAKSSRGEPVTVIHIAPMLMEAEDSLPVTVQIVVDQLEFAERAHHNCQSMPSLDGEDYVLARKDREIKDLVEILAVFKALGEYEEVWCELLYVGPFTTFQRDQALRLGGPASLHTARMAVARAKEIVKP